MSASTRAGIVHLGPCERCPGPIFPKEVKRAIRVHYAGVTLYLAMRPTPRFIPDTGLAQGAIAARVLAFLGFETPFAPPRSRLLCRLAGTEMRRAGG